VDRVRQRAPRPNQPGMHQPQASATRQQPVKDPRGPDRGTGNPVPWFLPPVRAAAARMRLRHAWRPLARCRLARALWRCSPDLCSPGGHRPTLASRAGVGGSLSALFTIGASRARSGRAGAEIDARPFRWNARCSVLALLPACLSCAAALRWKPRKFGSTNNLPKLLPGQSECAALMTPLRSGTARRRSPEPGRGP
jgi:hypothetical protein